MRVYTTIALLLYVCLSGLPGTTSKANATDASVNTELLDTPWWLVGDYVSGMDPSHRLYPYLRLAQQRFYPTRFIMDLIYYRVRIDLREASHAHYTKNMFGPSVLHLPKAYAPQDWSISEWSNFYNELFHAWWEHCFLKLKDHGARRSYLFRSSVMEKYRLAHRFDPYLAQEEAFSETIGFLLFTFSPLKDQTTGAPVFRSLNAFGYRIGSTVSSVSHGDTPGFTPEAEDIYPSTEEYQILLTLFSGMDVPSY